MKKLTFILLLALSLSLMACNAGDSAPGGSKEESTKVGDATAGEKLFAKGAQPPCANCHSLEPDVTLFGPSLAKISAVAGSRVSGQSAEDYLRQSILEPNAHIAEGFTPNVMHLTYGEELSEQETNDLAAYLLTLK
jgi:cytochrome c oxidase subunit 2